MAKQKTKNVEELIKNKTPETVQTQTPEPSTETPTKEEKNDSTLDSDIEVSVDPSEEIIALTKQLIFDLRGIYIGGPAKVTLNKLNELLK